MGECLCFTDGAAKGNPGRGGFGVVIKLDDQVIELGESKNPTTNNEMELRAVVAALSYISGKATKTTLYTDSKYVVEGATGWIFGWMKNGWQTKAGGDVLHKEVWQELVSLLKTVEVIWHKVPGHVGLIGNERADAIASQLGSGKEMSLYTGPRSDYQYEIENVDYDKEEAARRSSARKRQGMKAYSYVSEVDGVVETHKTWAETEARVKGKKARFKKALDVSEEQAIVADFSD